MAPPNQVGCDNNSDFNQEGEDNSRKCTTDAAFKKKTFWLLHEMHDGPTKYELLLTTQSPLRFKWRLEE